MSSEASEMIDELVEVGKKYQIEYVMKCAAHSFVIANILQELKEFLTEKDYKDLDLFYTNTNLSESDRNKLNVIILNIVNGRS
jgi:hypothetical protein